MDVITNHDSKWGDPTFDVRARRRRQVDFEEGIDMTPTAKVCPDDWASWDEALSLYRGQLEFYLDYLVPCECDHQILANVEAEVRERSVADEFKLRFLMRTLVRSVIEHLRACIHQREASHSPAQGDSATEIPAQERLIYFMRDILEYCTRDTSLLIGMTDAQVEKLLSFARKRIDMTEGPSSLEIQATESTYFRWKLVDLHRR